MEWYYIMGTVFAGLIVVGLLVKGTVYVISKLGYKVNEVDCQRTKDDLYDKFNDLKDTVSCIDKKEAVIKEKVGNIETNQKTMQTTLGKIWDHLQEEGA